MNSDIGVIIKGLAAVACLVFVAVKFAEMGHVEAQHQEQQDGTMEHESEMRALPSTKDADATGRRKSAEDNELGADDDRREEEHSADHHEEEQGEIGQAQG